jgi:hypothetical protein
VALAVATVVFSQSLPTLTAVDAPYQVRYAVNLTTAATPLDAYIHIANDGASASSICANVYAFDQTEAMISCCSCLVTPDETIGLSFASDVLSNSLTPATPASVTVKLVATAVPSGGSCAQSAAGPSAQTLANGMLAWGTTPHFVNQAFGQTTFFEGETPFLPATLSTAEVSSLASRCALIYGNGSGYGICQGCAVSSLGLQLWPIVPITQ